MIAQSQARDQNKHLYEQAVELKKLRKVLTVLAQAIIKQQTPTVGSEMLLEELHKIK